MGLRIKIKKEKKSVVDKRRKEKNIYKRLEECEKRLKKIEKIIYKRIKR